MENKLVLCYEIEEFNYVYNQILANVEQFLDIERNQINITPNNFKFLYDDFTGGEIEIQFEVFEKHKNYFKVVVLGNHAWEAIDVYQAVLPDGINEINA